MPTRKDFNEMAYSACKIIAAVGGGAALNDGQYPQALLLFSSAVSFHCGIYLDHRPKLRAATLMIAWAAGIGGGASSTYNYAQEHFDFDKTVPVANNATTVNPINTFTVPNAAL